MKLNNLNNYDDFEDLIPPFEMKNPVLHLDNIKKVLNDLNQPCKSIPAIQIVGTNGKGSIASFLESTLHLSEINVGVTTSPHLISWCERIRVDSKLISPSDLRENLIKIKPLSDKYKLSTFELIISVAFDYFRKKQVELIVLEAGLGGRLDATTVHPLRPIIAISSIGLDHCEYLGENLIEITKEKAAAISEGSIVISCQQRPEVTQIIKQVAKQKRAQLHWVKPLTNSWQLGLSGEFQKENAAIAKGVIEAISFLGWSINQETIRQGFAKACWPGRLQNARWNKLSLLIDGAHNPSAAKKLSSERETWQGQEEGINWIIGIQRKKAALEIIRNLIKQNDLFWIVPIPNHESWSISELLKYHPELSNQLIEAIEVKEALSKISIRNNFGTKRRTVITGSLFLIGYLIKNKIISI